MLRITPEIIHQIFPNNKTPTELAKALDLILPRHGFVTKKRVAAFLAQAGHESAGFTRFNENLNYSAEGLMKTWPKRFPTLKFAQKYHRNPEMIANYVYANRYGNGDEASGDGWKYRGRGCIQTTFKSNYQGLATYLNMDLDSVVRYCETLDGAIISGVYFWNIHNLNQYADKEDFTGLTKAINGGLNGLADRIAIYKKITRIIK